MTEEQSTGPGARIVEAGRRIYAAHRAESALAHRTVGEAVCEALMHAVGMGCALTSGLGPDGPVILPAQLAELFEGAADRAEEALAEATGAPAANGTNQDESAR